MRPRWSVGNVLMIGLLAIGAGLAYLFLFSRDPASEIARIRALPSIDAATM